MPSPGESAHPHLHGSDGALAERIDTPFRTRRALVFVTSIGAAARLAAGARAADILVPKHRYRGLDGKNVTVALALWATCPESESDKTPD